MLPKIGFILDRARTDSRPPQQSAPKPHLMFSHPPHSPPSDPPVYYAPAASSGMPALMLPPPIPHKYPGSLPPLPHSLPAHSSSDEYHKSSNSYYDARTQDHAFRQLQPPPPPPPPPPQISNVSPPAATLPYPPYDPYRPPSSVWHTPQTYVESLPPQPSSQLQEYYDDPRYLSPYTAPTPWEQDELSESNMLRRLREYNDLISRMDNEFWEQSDEVYREKLSTLQDELKTIQEGTHSAFQDLVADLEYKRDLTMEDATCLMKYQLDVTQSQFKQDQHMAKEEHENERLHLYETVMMVIDEWRKKIKDDKDDTVLNPNMLLREAYERMSGKRNVRKRAPPDRASPSRQETTRRRQNKPSTQHNINGLPSSREDEELKSDLMNMKGILPARRLVTSGNTSRR